MLFSSITNKERENLERVQMITKTTIELLSDRRQMLAGRYADKYVKSERFCDLFPPADNIKMDTRSNDKYVVNFANTDREIHLSLRYRRF